jgi:transcriptional regulator with XRE-family HTH domain
MWIGPKQHKIVGRHLAGLRQQAGMTQTDLAKVLRKPQSFVSAIENGQRRVDLLEFASIVRALGSDPQAIGEEIFALIAPAATPKRRKTRP